MESFTSTALCLYTSSIDIILIIVTCWNELTRKVEDAETCYRLLVQQVVAKKYNTALTKRLRSSVWSVRSIALHLHLQVCRCTPDSTKIIQVNAVKQRLQRLTWTARVTTHVDIPSRDNVVVLLRSAHRASLVMEPHTVIHRYRVMYTHRNWLCTLHTRCCHQ